MADPYYQHHAHYRQEHVQLPMSHSTSDFAHQQYSSSYEHELDSKDYGSSYSPKSQPFDVATVTPPQRPVYPMLHKDVSFASDFADNADTRSLATSRYPQFNTPSQHLDQQQAQEQPTGFLTKILPNSLACRLYLLTVLVETIVDIAIEVDLLVLVNNSDAINTNAADVEVTRLRVYLVVFGLAHLFQLVLALDAVHARNTLQFMFLIGFNALLLLYSIIQKAEILQSIGSVAGLGGIPVGALTAIIIAVISVSQVAFMALGYKIYTEFGWQVYKLLGADRGIKRMFMHLQIFLCLIKFDVFLFVGFGVQWLFLVLNDIDFEFYVTIAALPFSIVVLVVGHAAAHRENKWLMAAFVAGSTTACVYFVYKFWKILKFKNDPNLSPVFDSLLTFSVLAILFLVTTFAWAMIVMHNFGQGLKGRVAKHKHGASVAFSTRTGRVRRGSQFEMALQQHRLSID